MACPIQLQESSLTQSETTLVFYCDICPYNEEHKGNIAANTICRKRLLKLLTFSDQCVPTEFQTESHIFSVPKRSITLLKEYVDTLSQAEKTMESITQLHPDLHEKLFSNPLLAFELIAKLLRTKDSSLLQNLYSIIRRTRLYTSTQALTNPVSPSTCTTAYELLFGLKTKTRNPTSLINVENADCILDCYTVGPFKVTIFESQERTLEKSYYVVANLDNALSDQIIQFLSTKSGFDSNLEVTLKSLDDVMNGKIQEFQRFLSSSFSELTSTEQSNLAIFATTQSLELTKTMPLLLDDEVQEFYLDRPEDTYYLDHAQWGRCRTNLAPTKSELTRLVTRLRLESRRPLDETTPSLKTELKTGFFHVRAAVDIPPLAHDGLHLNIRKLRLRLLTLPELIMNNTITVQAAAFLILCMTLRLNITICGEPSSGKTTLANAINMTAPSFWRQIAIEDALESISVNKWGRHKVTFKVDPFDSIEEKRYTKSNEIIRLLHRSPDWVFLGEIQTEEHSTAMFHALSAGIRGIQTCHANSNDDLLLRWRIHHKIPSVCFKNLGLLVHMVRDISFSRTIRKIAQISEVDIQSEKLQLRSLYEWNRDTKQLGQLHENPMTPLIFQSCKYKQITPTEVQKRYQAYKEVLEQLCREEEYNPPAIMEAFNQIHFKLLSKPHRREATMAISSCGR
ncbi:MAG: ATPase, T2SS/T4P/T4SS family [Candidatus Bathyarchaeota archaeon]|nr:ATPase, T2SS/T4P/T4SS family [Candidatus Bathyarchaeota archaeon]